MAKTHGIASYREQLETLIGLSSSTVGVRFLADRAPSDGSRVLKQHRYCQVLMRARRGESVRFNGSGIACLAAAASGFRPLSGALQTGKGLIGSGIVADEAAGRRMFEPHPASNRARSRASTSFPGAGRAHARRGSRRG